jgi:hypothetical protein
MPNFGGVAYKANPKARTAGASPYDSTTVQKPPVHTGGAFNPAKATDNFTAASTKGGAIKANPGARTARGAKPY